MIVTVKRDRLLHELYKANRIISPKSLIPSLFGILIEVKKDKMVFTASDGDISIKSEILAGEDLQIKSIGTILIRGKYLIEVIRKLDDNFINLESLESSIVKISANKFNSSLNALNHIDYPNISFNEEGKEIIFNKQLLSDIIDQTAFAIGEREKRIVFNGLNFNNVKELNQLVITATDSFRLATKKVDYVNENDLDVIIPGKFIGELGKVILDYDDDINMKVSDKSVIVHVQNTLIKSKIIEGKYPDTNKVIPASFNTELTVNTKELIKTIERASVLTTEAMTTIITLKIKNNRVFITSNTQEIGNSEEEIKEFSLSGIDQIISLNSKFILEALRAFRTKEVTLRIVDEAKPLIIVANDDPSLQQLILPIRSY